MNNFFIGFLQIKNINALDLTVKYEEMLIQLYE